MYRNVFYNAIHKSIYFGGNEYGNEEEALKYATSAIVDYPEVVHVGVIKVSSSTNQGILNYTYDRRN